MNKKNPSYGRGPSFLSRLNKECHKTLISILELCVIFGKLAPPTGSYYSLTQKYLKYQIYKLQTQREVERLELVDLILLLLLNLNPEK